MKLLLKDLLTAYKLGVKTMYYHNTRDGADDASTKQASSSEGNKAVEVVETEEKAVKAALVRYKDITDNC